MSKIRISKKLVKELTSAGLGVLAEQIVSLGEQYNVKSFPAPRVRNSPHSLIAGEGDRYTVIYRKDGAWEVGSVEMVSEASLGAAGVNMQIGARVPIPEDCWLLTVWYYAGYGLTVEYIGGKALPAPLAG